MARMTTKQILENALEILRSRNTIEHGISVMLSDSISLAYVENSSSPIFSAIRILTNPSAPLLLKKGLRESGVVLEFDQQSDDFYQQKMEKVLSDALTVGTAVLLTLARENGIDIGPPKKQNFEDFGIADPGL